MADFKDILERFKPITLDEMNAVKLLNRMDRKYMFHTSDLMDVLSKSEEDYDVLVVGGKIFARYVTVYFDTPDYDLYTKHHNGKLDRYKIRFRNYVDSNQTYFEIKFKSNKDRTIKNRVRVDNIDLSIKGKAQKLLEERTTYKASSFVPAIQVNYNRITLVNKNMTERLTIDFGLNFICGNQHIDFPDLIISEVKQEKSEKSLFISIMQEKRIKDGSISKYCLGIASMISGVKINNFKSKIRYVNKLFAPKV